MANTPGTVLYDFADVQPVREATGFGVQGLDPASTRYETLYSFDFTEATDDLTGLPIGAGGIELGAGDYYIEIANDSDGPDGGNGGYEGLAFSFSTFTININAMNDPNGHGDEGYAFSNGVLNPNTGLFDPQWQAGLGFHPIDFGPPQLAFRISDVGSGLRADINGDGSVDIVDLVILATNFNNGHGQAALGLGDINGDGEVDILDLVQLGDNFGNTLPVPLAAVPEPGSLALLGLGGLTLIRRRRA